MKKCSKCKEEKPLAEFPKDKRAKDGLYSSCKGCVKKYYEANKNKKKKYAKAYREKNKEKTKASNKAWREANKDKIKKYKEENKSRIRDSNKLYYQNNKEKLKKWREENKDRIKEYGKAYREANKNKTKEYYEANKEKIKASAKAYYEANKDKISAYQKAWANDNRKKITDYQNNWAKKRRKEDPLFNLSENIRGRIYKLLNGTRSKSTENIIGCSFSQLYLHLNYDNLKDPSHDHIIPISWAETEEELYALARWENLQGMEKKENYSKGNYFCDKKLADSVGKKHPNPEIIKSILSRQLKVNNQYHKKT